MNEYENPGLRQEMFQLPSEQVLVLLDKALNASSIATVIADAADDNLPILFSNPAFQQLAATHSLTFSSTLRDFLNQGEPEDQRFNDPSLLGRIKESVVVKYVMPGPRTLWRELTLSPIQLESDPSTYVVAVIRDLTEQRMASIELEKVKIELEERVRERTSALERTNQDLEGFTHSVSHDLRAPLRAIMGFSKVLVEDHGREVDGEMRQTLDRINAAAVRMSTIIEDLLTFSRLGRKELIRQDLNLSDMARAIAADLLRRNPERDTRVEYDDGVITTGDPTLIRLAMENLLDNAYKFTSKTEGGLVEFRKLDENRFVVRDNGAGFDPQYSDKLFSPFERLHSSSDFPGTGIGLANVRRIVERHGGKIWADGEPDHGASFYFEL